MKVALYARVSSDRQDVDLSITAQLKALREYAQRQDSLIVKEYVDEAESGRTSQRPVFQHMIRDARRDPKPFETILVWKLSRFARNREDSLVYKALLRKQGVRLVSINEPFDDSPTGKLMEAIVESLDEFYSANLGQEVTRGMREAASRGFYVMSAAPYGYRRVKVKDGKKERASLQPDPNTAPTVRRIFSLFLQGSGLVEVVRALNHEGIPSPKGLRWKKMTIYNTLVNEAYIGTLVWGKNQNSPVRAEGAWEALVDGDSFHRANALLKKRGFAVQHPRRTASQYLLSGLAKCGSCGKALIGQDAKGGKFGYYVCGSLMKRGAGACDTPYLPKGKFEGMVVKKLKEDILTEEHLRRLVMLMAEEMDGASTQYKERLDTLDKELTEANQRLARLYDALETGQLVLEDLAPRIQELRRRKEQMEATREEVRGLMGERKRELLDLRTVTAYAEDLRTALTEGTLAEQKGFVRSFVQEITVKGGEATIRYTIPLRPKGSSGGHGGEVLSIVKFGGAEGTRTPYLFNAIEALSHLSYSPTQAFTIAKAIDSAIFVGAP